MAALTHLRNGVLSKQFIMVRSGHFSRPQSFQSAFFSEIQPFRVCRQNKHNAYMQKASQNKC